MKIDEKYLSELEALGLAATPGPWEAGAAMCCPDMGWVGGPRGVVCPQFDGTKRTHTLDANDAEFIASARTALPLLIAEVRRLRKALETIASGQQRGGMQTVIAQCALNPEMNEGGNLEWLEKK
jgi:hypothetical protein